MRETPAVGHPPGVGDNRTPPRRVVLKALFGAKVVIVRTDDGEIDLSTHDSGGGTMVTMSAQQWRVFLEKAGSVLP